MIRGSEPTISLIFCCYLFSGATGIGEEASGRRRAIQYPRSLDTSSHIRDHQYLILKFVFLSCVFCFHARSVDVVHETPSVVLPLSHRPLFTPHSFCLSPARSTPLILFASIHFLTFPIQNITTFDHGDQREQPSSCNNRKAGREVFSTSSRETFHQRIRLPLIQRQIFCRQYCRHNHPRHL